MENIKFFVECKLKSVFDENCNFGKIKADDISDDDKYSMSRIMFKNISALFKILSYVSEYCIIKSQKYKCIESNGTFKFPQNEDNLVFMLAKYSDAFDKNMCQYFYDLVADFKSYADMYSIGKINPRMIPFVADKCVDVCKLYADYSIFSNNVRSLSCYALNLTHCFKDSIIENI